MFVYVLLRFTVDGSLPRGLTVIVNFLALRQGDLTLDQVLLQINTGRNKREPFLLNTPRQLVKLLAMEQKPPVAEGFVIGVASCRIRADVAIDQEGLAALHVDIAVLEIDFSFPNRLHFRARQLHSRLKPLQKVIQMRCLPIDGKLLRSGLGGLGHEERRCTEKDLRMRESYHRDRSAANERSRKISHCH